MSEVRRYYTSLDHATYAQPKYDCNDEVVKASDYDADQSKLAALREDLAKRGQKIIEIADQRNAAEQRNAELVGLLTRSESFVRFVTKCVRKNGEYAPLHRQEMDELNRDLSAVISPTESGASE